MQRLPITLKHEPLIDAVFEVRLNNNKPPLADILPGILYHELEPKPVSIKRLPAAEIPQPIRADNPDLQSQPVLRLEWDRYSIAVGDRNIVIGCILPYPKWPNFKNTILELTERIAKIEIQGTVERYSVKYINLIKAPSFSEQISKIKMAIKLGPVEANDNAVSLQVHQKEGDVIHILNAIIGAEVKLSDDTRVSGAIVDIDSIHNINIPDFRTFAASLEPGLEQLRQKNKEIFFGCLTNATIEEMEPAYE